MSYTIGIVIAVGSINFTAYANEDTVQIHVAANGSDVWSGSKARPLATISGAKKTAMKYLGKDVEILIHSGTYQMNNVSFGKYDGRTEGKVTYKAYGDGEVVFTDSVRLSQRDFKTVTDPGILSRIRKEARGKVKRYDLKNDGITLSVSDSFNPYLYVNSKEKHIARYPNEGFLTAKTSDDRTSFTTDFNRNWNEAKEAVWFGTTSYEYFWSGLKISQISGETVKLRGTAAENIKYFVQNLLEEIDIPGEYFVDRNAGMLYYYPDGDIESAEITASAHSFSLKDTSNITFENITFKNIGGKALDIENSSGIDVIGCRFENVQGSYAIDIKNGKDCNISSNNVYSCDGGFVKYTGGEFKTLTPGNIRITDNFITECGRVLVPISAMIMSGENSWDETPEKRNNVGNIIENNVIGDCSANYAISASGNNNVVRYNEIYNCGRQINDGGAIYFGRSNVKYGNDISYNYIHDMNTDNSYTGIYTDDGYSGINVHHNVLRNMRSGVLAGVGMNNMYENNLIINCTEGVILGERMDWKGAYEDGGEFQNELLNVLNDEVSGPVFSSAYPEMIKAKDRTPYFAPYNTKAVGNVSIGSCEAVKNSAMHRYILSNGAYNIKNENLVPGINDALVMRGSIAYVDEMKAYGASVKDKNGRELNATSIGNPNMEYSDSLFIDSENENYSLKNKVFNSTASEIDMTDIGLINLRNSEREYGQLLYPKNGQKDVDEFVTLSWSDIKDASCYRVEIYADSSYTVPITEKVIYNAVDNINCCNVELENEKTYYWRVFALGIARQNSFNAEIGAGSFTTGTKGIANKEALRYAFELLENEVKGIENGSIIYPAETENLLKEKYYQLQPMLNQLIADTEADEAEKSIYTLLEATKDQKEYHNLMITECSAVSGSTIVNIRGTGLIPDEKITVLVTNPNYELTDIKVGLTMNCVQFTDTVKGNEKGEFFFSFDTSVNDIDMPGVYGVYISTERGKFLEEKYTYGTVELSKANIIPQSDNKAVVEFEVTNRLNYDIMPRFIAARYNQEKLISACSEQNTVLMKNSSQKVSFDMDLSVGEADTLKLFVFEDMQRLRPLSIVRFIYNR